MITSDAKHAFSEIPIEPPGDGAWVKQFCVPVDCAEGGWVHAHGKIQFKCYEPFAVECRMALIFEVGMIAVRIAAKRPANILHPVTGANVHPEVGDKYLVLSEQVYFQPPAPSGFVVLRVSARSTRAVPTSRIAFGNGLLQARVL
jgi:hypothetical protein